MPTSTMYLRTAALVLLVSLALSAAIETNEESDDLKVTISNYAPHMYASGSCAMRRRMYQEQYYYGSAEDRPYEHHEHKEGYKEERHGYKHDGYESEAAAQGKGKVASENEIAVQTASVANSVQTASAPEDSDVKTTPDATVSAQLLAVDSQPAAEVQDLFGKSLDQVLHNSNAPGSNFYAAQVGSGAQLPAGWNGLLEDGQSCLSDWACCSGKCSESTCCSIEKLSNTQACRMRSVAASCALAAYALPSDKLLWAAHNASMTREALTNRDDNSISEQGVRTDLCITARPCKLKMAAAQDPALG